MRAVVNPDGNLYVAYGSYPGPNSMSYGLVEKFNPANNSWTNITPPLDTAEGENSQSGGFCGLTQDPNRSGTLAVSTLDRWYSRRYRIRHARRRRHVDRPGAPYLRRGLGRIECGQLLFQSVGF